MNAKETLSLVGIGALSGVAGLQVMDPVTTVMQDMMPEDARQKEEAVTESQGSAMTNAAEKAASAVGVELNKKQTETTATVFHYAIGILGGLVYTFVRRQTNLNPVLTGLLTGLGMFLFLDEGLNTVMGFSAPPSAYPKETHLRGLVGHLSFGIAAAAAAEALQYGANKLDQ